MQIISAVFAVKTTTTTTNRNTEMLNRISDGLYRLQRSMLCKLMNCNDSQLEAVS